MKNLIELLSNPLGVALVLLPMSISAKNLLGLGHAGQSNDIKWNFFKRGLLKGFLIYMGIGVIAIMSLISKDLSVTVGGNTYGLVEAVTVIVMGAVALYIKDTFEILMKIFKTETTKESTSAIEHQEEK